MAEVRWWGVSRLAMFQFWLMDLCRLAPKGGGGSDKAIWATVCALKVVYYIVVACILLYLLHESTYL
jgi:hypothetical protein